MNKILSRLMVSGSAIALAASSANVAYAQGDSENIETVTVSASRISIAGYTAPTPVTVVGAAELEANAKNDLGDAIRQLPAVQGASPQQGSSSVTISGATAGQSNVSLHNLGNLRTLVLIDGQRVVFSNVSGGVDINTIPATLVQRVDVVTGGVSAAWGSDAVAGVINLIINKNFTGFKGNLEYSDNSADIYRSIKSEASYGADIFGGRGHFIVSGMYQYSPDTVYTYTNPWYHKTQIVNNPAYNKTTNPNVPQQIRVSNIGQSTATPGGLIVSNPKGTAANSANILRGIDFVGPNAVPTPVNIGNVIGPAAWGGDLGFYDSQTPITITASPNTQTTLFAFGAYNLTDSIRASVQINFGKDYIQNTGTTAEKLGNLVITSDNPFIPATVKATMTANGITSFSMGTTNMNNVNVHNFTPADAALSVGIPVNREWRQMTRAVFSLDGTIGNDWGWNAYYQYGINKTALRVIANSLIGSPGLDTNGKAIPGRFDLAADAVTVTAANVGTTGLALGSIACRSVTADPSITPAVRAAGVGCKPIDVFGTGVADLHSIAWINSYDSIDQEDVTVAESVFAASVQGTLPWQLPAGAIAVATGAEWRHEQGHILADPRGASAQWGSGNFANMAGGYTVAEGFGEVDMPLLKDQIVNDLSFNAAGRITSYSTSGMVETWKLGFTSQVTDDIKLRTGWSTDIRAPNIAELFTAHQINTGAAIDLHSPSCTSTTLNQFGFVNSVAGCSSPFVATDRSGNPNLVPEVGRTITAGVVLTPSFLDNFQVAVDYYETSISGSIVTLVGNPTNCAAALAVQYCSLLIFGGANYSNGKPALTVQSGLPVNAASERASGFDMQMDYGFDFFSGHMQLSYKGTYVDEHTIINVGVTCDQIGQVGLASCGGDTLPKFKGTLGATYTEGPLSLTLQSRFQGSFVLNHDWTSGVQIDKNEIDPNAYLDIRASYKWNDNVQFYTAIDNALDIPPILVPPLASTGSSFQSIGFTGDMLGRVMRIGVRITAQ
ncbi:MAG TPA: TonB-dependent receptor [Rhizomicrobium sp.]|nr:TonB-dependent receptor [Rhizomicrobium sp.]